MARDSGRLYAFTNESLRLPTLRETSTKAFFTEPALHNSQIAVKPFEKEWGQVLLFAYAFIGPIDALRVLAHPYYL